VVVDRTETFQPKPTGGAIEESHEGTPSSHARTLGPYQLLFRIGGGGMADVWVAVRRGSFGFRQHFAVKTIRAEYGASAAFRAMFLDEARLASQIHHTNVLPVLDLGEDGGIVYQAMPLVEGDSVAALLRASRGSAKGLPLDVVVRIGIDAARGLHAAHEAVDEAGRPLHIVHRDVSPHNLLVGRDGTAKVSDFGIAKAFGTTTGGTSSGDVKGKRAYLAPEQLLRKDTIDRRADVFSLGVVLWEMVTGRRLFETGDSAMFFSLTDRIPDVRDACPSVPEALASVIARAAEASPDDRFATSEALADALETAARDSGLSPSAKDVGRLVVELLGAGVAERERELADRTRDLVAEHTAQATVVDSSPSRRTRRSVPAALALVVVLAAVGALFLRRATPEKRATSETPPAASTSEVQPTASAAPAPAESVLPTASVSVSVSPPAKPAPRVAKPPPALQPKFSGNPYAR
jgi:serine/threonine-protein kinase